MTMELDLSGYRALVTGAGQGVGRAVALRLATAGAEVVVNDINVERAEAVVEEARALGDSAIIGGFDVTDYAAVAAAVDSVGDVDIIVNNAGNAGAEGFTGQTPFAQSEPDQWERYLRVNLYGVMHCTRAVLPAMVAKGWGRVITIVSDSGRTGDAGMAAYSASKAGAAGFTRTIALENGRHGITANNIALGTMRTPLTEAMWADADNNPTAKAMMRRYVIRRPGLPEDVAPMAVLLASPESAWITGQTIPVNGGFSFSL
jgi:NAD(P)-dependent dehydrogenase (short-subunit alcohol dehydrogenase family)